MPNLRQRLIKEDTESYKDALFVHRNALDRKVGSVLRGDEKITLAQLEADITFLAGTISRLRDSKTIVFPVEQIVVFASLLEKKLIIPLEYKLPFQAVLVEFSAPVEVIGFDGTKKAVGFLLEQREETKAGFNEIVNRVRSADRAFEFEDSRIIDIDWSKGESVMINHAMLVYEDLYSAQIVWTSHDPNGFNTDESWDANKLSVMEKLKQLAIACIGYINCENVYLHREGVVSDSINAKRERKGKSKLEPYYVCRIRGVQYNSDGSEKGTGSKQSIRYDVRGHFRRYESGKTTWVRAHQRGLTNELYVPKTYVVDKKAQS